MTEPLFDTIAVVGLGLIGSSVAARRARRAGSPGASSATTLHASA